MSIHSTQLLPIVLLCTAMDMAQAEEAPAAPSEFDPAGMESAETGEPTGSEPEASGIVAEYERSAQQLETETGVYDARLGEELLGLGLAYRNAGRNYDASETFKRALQITRVNEGLQSMKQLPTLELLIEENTALGDWAALDQYHHQLYWLYSRNYGPADPKLLPVIDRAGRWHLHAYRAELDDLAFEHLREADLMYDRAAEIIKTHYGEIYPGLIEVLQGTAISNWLIANYMVANDRYESSDFRTTTRSDVAVRVPANASPQQVMAAQQRARAAQRAAAQAELVYAARMQEQRRYQIIARHFSKGKDAMQQIVAILEASPQSTPVLRAGAMAQLGDWYLMFDKPQTAIETYEQASRFLSEQNVPQQKIDQLFGRPRQLPVMMAPLAGENPGNSTQVELPEATVVKATVDVSRHGKPMNIAIVEAPDDATEALHRRVRRTIAGARFRPRLEAGQVVDTRGATLTYRMERDPAEF